jgi:hypothetical protein
VSKGQGRGEGGGEKGTHDVLDMRRDGLLRDGLDESGEAAGKDERGSVRGKEKTKESGNRNVRHLQPLLQLRLRHES